MKLDRGPFRVLRELGERDQEVPTYGAALSSEADMMAMMLLEMFW